VGRVSWPRNALLFLESRALDSSKAAVRISIEGERFALRTGLGIVARMQEDGPVTWETLYLHQDHPGWRRPGRTTSDPQQVEGCTGCGS
jgi:hypothetical protein